MSEPLPRTLKTKFCNCHITAMKITDKAACKFMTLNRTRLFGSAGYRKGSNLDRYTATNRYLYLKTPRRSLPTQATAQIVWLTSPAPTCLQAEAGILLRATSIGWM